MAVAMIKGAWKYSNQASCRLTSIVELQRLASEDLSWALLRLEDFNVLLSDSLPQITLVRSERLMRHGSIAIADQHVVA